jgi:uncharacterized protein (DUF433 family)
MNGIHRVEGLCGGRPVIEATGVETRVVLDRFLGGDSIGTIAADYDITPEDAERAIRFECCRACKCKDCAWARKIPVEESTP